MVLYRCYLHLLPEPFQILPLQVQLLQEELREQKELQQQAQIEAMRKQEQAEWQKEEERRQKEQAIHLLLQLGVSKVEITQKLGLSEEDMERL